MSDETKQFIGIAALGVLVLVTVWALLSMTLELGRDIGQSVVPKETELLQF